MAAGTSRDPFRSRPTGCIHETALRLRHRWRTSSGICWRVPGGGPSRVRILRKLDERPRNANQLADELNLDYTTVRHHLDVFMDNNVVRRTDNDYATTYLLTDHVRANWDTVEEILDTVDPEDA